MNKKQVQQELCRIAGGLVGHYLKKKYSCTCHLQRTKPTDFEYDENILKFVCDAVLEKMDREDKNGN